MNDTRQNAGHDAPDCERWQQATTALECDTGKIHFTSSLTEILRTENEGRLSRIIDSQPVVAGGARWLENPSLEKYRDNRRHAED
jgi:hypothetical protein